MALSRSSDLHVIALERMMVQAFHFQLLQCVKEKECFLEANTSETIGYFCMFTEARGESRNDETNCQRLMHGNT